MLENTVKYYIIQYYVLRKYFGCTCVSYEIISGKGQVFGVFIGEGICSHRASLGVVVRTTCVSRVEKGRRKGKGERGGEGGKKEI